MAVCNIVNRPNQYVVGVVVSSPFPLFILFLGRRQTLSRAHVDYSLHVLLVRTYTQTCSSQRVRTHEK
jgi:hypothetical protein